MMNLAEVQDVLISSDELRDKAFNFCRVWPDLLFVSDVAGKLRSKAEAYKGFNPEYAAKLLEAAEAIETKCPH